MGADLNRKQSEALRRAVTCQRERDAYESLCRKHSRHALELGVPILTLANALGVSRGRIRRLAR